MMTRIRFAAPLVWAALLALTTAVATPRSASGSSGGTLYVDGKTGLDTNSGTSPGAAFKTISRAASAIPSGSSAAGWTVEVQGYSDYIYRERPIPSGWNGQGSAGAHVVFKAAGYVAGGSGYVKPIVSGADAAPSPGNSWQSTSTSGVWRTPWATEPFDYGASWGPIGIAIFEDTTKWLWAYSSLSGLAGAAKKGSGGFYWDKNAKQLYVSAVSSTGPSGANPTGHTIDVIVRNTFYFNGTKGVRYVDVRGFVVQHSANGIAFAMGTDYGTAADNVVRANLYMGIQTRGYQSTSGPDPSIGNQIVDNTGSYNTVQMIKIDEGTQNSTFCRNSASANGLQGIKIQGPPSGSSYTGTTTDNTICDSQLFSQNYNPTGSTYNNASGLTIANGARNTTVTGNSAWGNDVGVMVSQEKSSRPAIEGVTMTSNKMWGNRRFGLYFFDGYYGSGAGHATSTGDAIWGNGMGVMVDRGSTNKTIDFATIHGNSSDGIRVGVARTAAASLTLKRSLVTDNGGRGIWLVSGSHAYLYNVGLAVNKAGNIYGSPSQSAVNSKVAGYLSVDPDDPNFLTITPSSYQYTAGPGGTPIGAFSTSDPAPEPERSTYVGLTPSRILDTTVDLQRSAPLVPYEPATFQVTGQFPADASRNVPANATAVTGVVSVANPTGKGYLSVSPTPVEVPGTSSLNFPVGDSRSAGITVPLGPGGTLSVTYGPAGNFHADVRFDVTGYYVPDDSGSTFTALTPNRVLDSRTTVGDMAGGLVAGTHRTFQVVDRTADVTTNVPATATAVTGNLTVTGQTKAGVLVLTPDADDSPTTASIYFPTGDNRATGVTMKLGPSGTLSVVYLAPAGATTQVVFDVTGYFAADGSGAKFVPIVPSRLVDSRSGTRLGLSASLKSGYPAKFQITDRSNAMASNVPSSAVAVTGTLTAVWEKSAGYMSLTTVKPVGALTTSTINFPKGDTRATGVVVPLASGGSQWITFRGTTGTYSDVVFDVTGYFTP